MINIIGRNNGNRRKITILDDILLIKMRLRLIQIVHNLVSKFNGIIFKEMALFVSFGISLSRLLLFINLLWFLMCKFIHFIYYFFRMVFNDVY